MDFYLTLIYIHLTCVHAGNEAPNKPMCLNSEMIKPFIVEQKGFEYINEGTEIKPKRGFVSNTPGSMLKIRIDTTSRKPVGSVPVYLAYLRSYTRMGIATLDCIAGCTCPRSEVCEVLLCCFVKISSWIQCCNISASACCLGGLTSGCEKQSDFPG